MPEVVAANVVGVVVGDFFADICAGTFSVDVDQRRLSPRKAVACVFFLAEGFGGALELFGAETELDVHLGDFSPFARDADVGQALEECFFLGFIVAFGEFLDFLIPCAVEAAVYGAVVSQGESFTVLAGIETFECVDDWDNVVGVANAAGTFVEKVMLLAG